MSFEITDYPSKQLDLIDPGKALGRFNYKVSIKDCIKTISREGWIVNVRILFPAFLLLTDAFSWVTVQE